MELLCNIEYNAWNGPGARRPSGLAPFLAILRQEVLPGPGAANCSMQFTASGMVLSCWARHRKRSRNRLARPDSNVRKL